MTGINASSLSASRKKSSRDELTGVQAMQPRRNGISVRDSLLTGKPEPRA